MFCPECGAADQRVDSYCRKCGQWLADHKSLRTHRARTPDHILKDIMVFSGVNALLALTSAIVLYATYLGSKDAKWSVYVAAALSLVISIHQTVSFFFNLQLRRRFSRQRQVEDVTAGRDSVQENILMPASSAGDLISQASITERTTELLEPAPLVREIESQESAEDARGRRISVERQR
ncbi:MAG TPA: hypothetical protein VEZ90_18975 [Blastocatellia bacterium]|nr:hypothetical protein [Blastocatellia bacterium]